MKTFNFYLEHLFIWAQEKPHLKLLETNTTQTILSLKKKNCNFLLLKLLKCFIKSNLLLKFVLYILAVI